MYTGRCHLPNVWLDDRAKNISISRAATSIDFYDAGFRRGIRRLWLVDGDQEKTIEYASDLVA